MCHAVFDNQHSRIYCVLMTVWKYDLYNLSVRYLSDMCLGIVFYKHKIKSGQFVSEASIQSIPNGLSEVSYTVLEATDYI